MKLKNLLDKKLSSRPAKQELVQSNIIKGGNVAPSLQATQEQLKNLKMKDTASSSTPASSSKSAKSASSSAASSTTAPVKPSSSTPADDNGKKETLRGKLEVKILEARNLSSNPNAKPYCLVEFEHNQDLTPAQKGATPAWNASFAFDVNGRQSDVAIMIYDRDNSDDFLGMVKLKPNYRNVGATGKNWFGLYSRQYSDRVEGEVHVELTFNVTKKKMTIDDFDLLKVIGIGSFGKVMLVKKKDTERLYAMKILKKNHILQRDEVDHTRSERVILEKNQNPFLVGLKFAFQTPEKIYLVLDFVNGGELFYHLQNEGKFDEDRAKFYAAQLLLALEHLHTLDVVYRDLKPENILVDYSGYIALTDFGLCKEDVKHDGKTSTFCGTPEYMAPEVLKKQGYGPAVDWWTLGILLYEMISGLPPYYDENTNLMYQNILYGDLVFPPGVSSKAQSLIKGLLNRDPEKRMGAGPRGALAIREHPFFANISWPDLLARKYRAPWKPQLSSDACVRNFAPEFTQMTPEDSVVEDSPLGSADQRQFQGFTFTGDSEYMS